MKENYYTLENIIPPKLSLYLFIIFKNNRTYKLLARLVNKKREKTSITSMRSEKEHSL